MSDFANFYQELHPRLIASLAAWCGDLDLATDAADEAAIRALERWPKVEAMANPEGWVFRVAMNQVRRRAKRRSVERNLLRRERPTTSVPGPAGEMWILVSDLSARQREAIVLRHIAQLTEPEIAEVMGVTRGTVSATLRQGYANLRSALSADEQQADEQQADGLPPDESLAGPRTSLTAAEVRTQQ